MLIEILLILSLSTLLVGLFYLPGIKTDLNFADEGYLWYGTLKVLEGEVPIRDFRAYDPGRYYWLALWMRALGRTLMSLRIGLLVTQIGALTAGLTAVYIATHEARIRLNSSEIFSSHSQMVRWNACVMFFIRALLGWPA